MHCRYLSIRSFHSYLVLIFWVHLVRRLAGRQRAVQGGQRAVQGGPQEARRQEGLHQGGHRQEAPHPEAHRREECRREVCLEMRQR